MKKYGYHEVRVMHADSLRALCIRQNWFTRGDNEEYSKLLDKAQYTTNITTDDIVELATVILEYSDLDKDYTTDDHFRTICFELLRICTTWIAEDGEE